MTVLALLWLLLPSQDGRTSLVDATVWVLAGAEGRGTGWVCNRERRWIVTNYHVVGDANEIDLIFPEFRDGKLVTDRESYVRDFNRLRRRFRLIRRHLTRDLASIEAQTLPDQAKSLGLAASTYPGQAVCLVGNRRDLDTLWNFNRGKVRQSFHSKEGIPWRTDRLAKGCRLLAIDSLVHEGDSGGPVVNDRHEVVGVVSAVLFQAQQITAAIELDELRAFLEEPLNKTPPEKREPTPYEKALRSVILVESQSSRHRATGIIVNAQRKIAVTTLSAVGSNDRVLSMFPRWDKQIVLPDIAAYVRQPRVSAVVMAKDSRRNLALVQLGSISTDATSVDLVDQPARTGESLHAIGNPNGIEALWLYSAVHVRQTGKVVLSSKKEDGSAEVLILQSPAAGNDSGGPIVNTRGELVAIASGKEGPESQVAYALGLAEIQAFLREHRWVIEPKVAESYVRRMERFRRVHWWNEAANEAKEAIRIDPKHAATWQLLPELTLQSGNKSEALALAKKALEILPPRLQSGPLMTLARIRLLESNSSAAGEHIQSILLLDPKCAPAFVLRAALHRLAVRVDLAMKDADEAIWLAPNAAEGFAERSLIHVARKDYDRALDDVNRAIELDPYNPALWESRAALQLVRGEKGKSSDDKKAAEELRKANQIR